MTNPRDKGKRVEAYFSEVFKKYFGGNWQRVPFSGAMLGRSNAGRAANMNQGTIQTFRGDIIPDENMPNLVLESKGYKGFNYDHFISPKGSPAIDAWTQQVHETLPPGCLWFLLVKINHKGEFICGTYRPTYALGNHVRYTAKFKLKDEEIKIDCFITEVHDFLQNNVGVIRNLASQKLVV